MLGPSRNRTSTLRSGVATVSVTFGRDSDPVSVAGEFVILLRNAKLQINLIGGVASSAGELALLVALAEIALCDGESSRTSTAKKDEFFDVERHCLLDDDTYSSAQVCKKRPGSPWKGDSFVGSSPMLKVYEPMESS